MDINQTIAKLYYLLVSADGVICEKEKKIGQKMIDFEKLDKNKFYEEFNKLDTKSRNEVYVDCLNGLHKLTKSAQVKYIAWMSIVANSDGILDDTEWKLIYQLYSKEFGLPFTDINNMQKELKYELAHSPFC